MRVLLAALATAGLALAQFTPPGVTPACTAGMNVLMPKIEEAAEFFLDANLNCLNQCDKEVAKPCSTDCISGLTTYSTACTGAGGRIFVVGQRITFDTPGSPLLHVNQYTCVATQCDNADDRLVYDAYFQTLFCNRPGGAPVKECFVDVREFAVLPAACRTPLDAMRADAGYKSAIASYRTANAGCLSSCSPRGQEPCTVSCQEGAPALEVGCQAASASMVVLRADVALSSGKGNASITYADCAPSACSQSDSVAGFNEDATADYCDDFSATDVGTCQVRILPGGFGGDAGAVAGAVVGVIIGVGCLVFGGYHLGAQRGWFRKESVPGPVRYVLDCGRFQGGPSTAEPKLTGATSTAVGAGGGYSTI